jgi:hypothetical protein
MPRAILERPHGRFDLVLTVPLSKTECSLEIITDWSMNTLGSIGVIGYSATHVGHPVPGIRDTSMFSSSHDEIQSNIKLVQSSSSDCMKSCLQLQEISSKRKRLALAIPYNMKSLPQNSATDHSSPMVAEAGASAEFLKIRSDIYESEGYKAMDMSRVDALVAVRLRLAGFSQLEVEAAVLECVSPQIQKNEDRDWVAYAKRAATYAFGAGGARVAETILPTQKGLHPLHRLH